MHFFGTNDKPHLVNATSTVSLLILAGLTLAGITVALAVMVPVLLVLSMILVPVVITTSFLATGFLASGGLGASGIVLLFCLYKLRKEEPWRYKMDTQEVRHAEGTNKVDRGENPLEVENDDLVEVEKRADEENGKPWEEDKPPEEDKHKLPPIVVLLERDLPQRQSPIPQISKVPRRYGPRSTYTKRSNHVRLDMNHTKVIYIYERVSESSSRRSLCI